MNELGESKALTEVREWKATCARDVAGFDIIEAVRKRLSDSAETAKKLGFFYAVSQPMVVTNVAEKGQAYGVSALTN